MTQLSSGTLRLWTGADTLLIGHRAAFGHGRGLCRLDSEDEVRRRLIQAMADPRSLDSLRAFWARYQFDTRRMTHTTDRALIDRVAQTTVRGPLAVYVVPDASVKHVHGSAMAKVMPLRPLQQTPSSTISNPVRSAAPSPSSPAPGVDAPFAAGTPSNVGAIGAKRGDEATSGALQVALMPLEDRIVEVLRRAPRRMPAQLQEQSSKLFATATFAATAQVLSGWAASHAIGAGFQIEAVMLADGLARTSSAAMEASEKLEQAFAIVRQARDERQLDDAALPLAEAIGLLGIPAFMAAIWRGGNRFTSVSKSRGLR
ncbi:MAG: hypothetical protein V7604_4588 [Hyphomicrobiales bacterium]